jgi:hypothetical protein
VNADQITVEQWLAIRKQAALHMDPETAEVEWIYADITDPYGVLPECERGGCLGRAYFARTPGSNVWVEFGDLPKMTHDALWQKHGSKWGFPPEPPRRLVPEAFDATPDDHTCVQCKGRVDGQEQLCAIGDDVVWLHPQCQRFYIVA